MSVPITLMPGMLDSTVRNCVDLYLERECPNSCKACGHKIGLDTTCLVFFHFYSPPSAESAGPPIKPSVEAAAQPATKSVKHRSPHQDRKQRKLKPRHGPWGCLQRSTRSRTKVWHSNAELNRRDRCVVLERNQTPALASVRRCMQVPPRHGSQRAKRSTSP